MRDRIRKQNLRDLFSASWRLSPSTKDARRLWVCLVSGFLEPHAPKLRTGKIREIRISTNDGIRTVSLRANGSDIFTFYEIFLKQVYRRALPLRDGATVVDLGANIGMTALWLATQAKGVRVVAVEPEDSNIDLLRRNVSEDDVVVVHAAIAAQPGKVRLQIGSPSGHRIGSLTPTQSQVASQEVDALDPDELVGRYALENIDVLKVDIEGAEADIFCTSWALVDRAQIVLMEVHDDAARVVISRALERQGLTPLERPDAEAPDAFVRRHAAA
jgi:FkbM family methyltransferase